VSEARELLAPGLCLVHAKPYLIELGRVVLAWNDLHEKLAELYCVLKNYDPSASQRWHGARNDKVQRKLLRNAVRAT
jgi:hypothetical protein